MKTRIALTLAVILGGGALDRALFSPVATIVKNQAAIATVNGGDSAFVAQQAIHTGVSLGSVLLLIAGLVALVLIWTNPVKKLFAEETVDPIS